MSIGQRSQKVCIFVDNNALARVLRGRKVNFKLLKNWLAGDREPVVAHFYCGETNRTIDSRRRFYESLTEAGFDVKVLRNPISQATHPEEDEDIESGINCQIVWDMARLVQQGYYDAFVILSGAYEIAEVAQEIRRLGVELEVAFDSTQCSPSLRGASTRFRELSLDSILLSGWTPPHSRTTEKVIV